MAEPTTDELRRAGIQTAIDTQKDLRARLNADEDIYLDLLDRITPNYMKPTTATTDESMQRDAERDARFAAFAADALLAAFRLRYPKPKES